jgi:hypothetical protein
MGLEADVALDSVGPPRTPGLDCLLPLAAEIFLDFVAHQARLMRRFTFRLDTEPRLTLRRVANILHFARPAIAAILGRRARKANMRFAPAITLHDRIIGSSAATPRDYCLRGDAGTNGNGKHEQSMAFQPTDIGSVGMCIRLPCLAPSAR